MTTPDLQAVLATLAQLSQPAQQVSSQATSSHGNERINDRPIANLVQPTKKVIDPATITTWQEGLRCVTKIAAQNKNFEESLRRMMYDQRANEARWLLERQKLKERQANRSKSTAEAVSILQSLSSSVAGPAEETSPEAELAALHMKIYRAQETMQADYTLELKALGVPFFGTQPALILEDGDEVEAAVRKDQPSYSQPISRTQLLALQRRMVQHLEDLYRD